VLWVCALVAGVPLSQQELDKECEEYLYKHFGEKLDFAIENSLPFLLEDGLISDTADVRWFPTRVCTCPD
jgi:hypothetical protein